MAAYKITNLVIHGDDGGEIAARIMSEIVCVDHIDDLHDFVRQSTVLEVEHFDYTTVPSVQWALYGLMGGEANDVYRRGEFPLESRTAISIARTVKALCGLTALKCRREEYGDYVRFHPYGLHLAADYQVVYP